MTTGGGYASTHRPCTPRRPRADGRPGGTDGAAWRPRGRRARAPERAHTDVRERGAQWPNAPLGRQVAPSRPGPSGHWSTGPHLSDHGTRVFILYAIPVGIVVGLLLRGRLSGVASLQLRAGVVMVAGLWAQVLLFSTPIGDTLRAAAPAASVASTFAVLIAILVTLRIPGLSFVAAGAAANLLVIVANGGVMPASAAAYAEQGRATMDSYSNTAMLHQPVLGFLGDVIALPTWLPGTNVISLGDVLIALG